ncbi:DUF4446 family protein [Paratissierella segnis]|jgi:hypothetical protein|uniref:DUF4446 family protein n=1 Tax=Paratissierella segnis TaxID=2763679 RepID=A0A926IIZ6_9FIRM|nr:DUF4446 family protein [Paratissierella segnis]MBC8586725.1 DUF4446 family protein [Paratissierella segnis]
MVYIREFISAYFIEVILGLVIAILILFILLLITQSKIKKSKEKYNSFMRGLTGVNIEDLLIHIDKDIRDMERDINLIENSISSFDAKLAFAIQKIGFIRYNAFDGIGSELSFSIALLDNFQNGFVLTSIYGRETSISFAKPIKNGESNIPLSAEELIAIDRAIKGEMQEKSI